MYGYIYGEYLLELGELMYIWWVPNADRESLLGMLAGTGYWKANTSWVLTHATSGYLWRLIFGTDGGCSPKAGDHTLLLSGLCSLTCCARRVTEDIKI